MIERFGTEPDPVTVTAIEEGEKVFFDWQQPGWDKMAESLRVLRDNRLAKDMDWGRAELEIPVAVLHFLKRKYPDLDAHDREIKAGAWKRLLATGKLDQWRVRSQGRFLARSVGGIDDGRQCGRGDLLADSQGKASDGAAIDQSLCGGAQGHAGLGD